MRLTRSEKIVIVGAGDHARVVLDILRETKQIKDVVGMIDVYENPNLKDAMVDDEFPVLGNAPFLVELFASKKAKSAIVCVGKNRDREKLINDVLTIGFKLITAVHPSAIVSARTVIGEGCMVCAGSVLVTGTRLGRSVIVNTGATVDHDCDLGDCTFVAPGAHLAGRVKMMRGSMVGIGASVRQGMVIGEYSMVASGAAVVSDVPNMVTVAGIPARIMKPPFKDQRPAPQGGRSEGPSQDSQPQQRSFDRGGDRGGHGSHGRGGHSQGGHGRGGQGHGGHQGGHGDPKRGHFRPSGPRPERPPMPDVRPEQPPNEPNGNVADGNR